MDTYPNTPAYAILYTPGSSGAFLGLLVATIHGTPLSSVFSPHGNAHRMAISRNIVSSLPPTTEHNRFLDVKPIDPKKAIVISEHQPIDYAGLFAKYPLAKNAIIQYTVDDVPLIETNFYFKYMVDSFASSYLARRGWREYTEKYFGGAIEPDSETITHDMVSALIADRVAEHPIHAPTNVGDYVDQPNVTYFNFHDLLNDKDKTLAMVSEMTGQPITADVEKAYDDYILAQKPIRDFVGS